MDGTFLLRLARPADQAAVVAVLRDTFETTWRPNITEAAANAFLEENRPAQYFGEHGLAFHVAVRGGEVVGFVHWVGDFVHALHVRSSHSRSGVGAALMDLAEAGVADDGHRWARLETDSFNLRSRAFYAARGYREAGRYPDAEWNSGLTTILLVKRLVGSRA